MLLTCSCSFSTIETSNKNSSYKQHIQSAAWRPLQSVSGSLGGVAKGGGAEGVRTTYEFGA